MLYSAVPLAMAAPAGMITAAPPPPYSSNPFVIELDIPAPTDSAGGIVVADLDSDGRMDYLVTVPGHIAAYANDGRRLWVRAVDVRVGGPSEGVGLPGHHGPGVQAGQVDDEGTAKVVFLTQDSVLHVADARTGEDIWTARPPVPEGAERWEHVVIANFRGKGDRDILLQATNAQGYRMGRFIAAFALDQLRQENYEPLWQRDDFLACAHNGARLIDLDGDGRDEVLGGTIVSPTGEILFRIPLKGHIDAIHAFDVRPDLPGLEVVALEEGGGNRIFCYSRDALIWETHYQHWEPQNTAIGEFDLTRPGLEIWCRSRFDKHQKPFVFDARGQHFAGYEMDQVAPEGWTDSGVEVIHSIHWTGEEKQLAAAKERHTAGDVCIFEPVTGRFVERFPEKADRLYVADVTGDWREELIVLSGNIVRVYHNPAENPRPDQPRLWSQPHYRRSKMTHNYYSP